MAAAPPYKEGFGVPEPFRDAHESLPAPFRAGSRMGFSFQRAARGFRVSASPSRVSSQAFRLAFPAFHATGKAEDASCSGFSAAFPRFRAAGKGQRVRRKTFHLPFAVGNEAFPPFSVTFPRGNARKKLGNVL